MRTSSPVFFFAVLAIALEGTSTHAEEKTPPEANPQVSLPEAPDGFNWQSLPEVRGYVLRPDGWHFSHASTPHGITYFITKDKIQDGRFLTGLTINAIQNVREKSKIEAELYAAHYIKEYIKDAKEASKPNITKGKPFAKISLRVKKKLPDVDPGKTFVLQLQTLANVETDTLYVISFGAPEAEWQAAWAKGEKLFSPLALSKSY